MTTGYGPFISHQKYRFRIISQWKSNMAKTLNMKQLFDHHKWMFTSTMLATSYEVSRQTDMWES